MIKSYLRYYLKSTAVSKVKHSFVKELQSSVFSKLNTVDDVEIQRYVKSLKVNKGALKVTDLGAGSKVTNTNIRSVKSIAKNAAVSQKFGQLLSLLIKEFKCENVIELGTSLGIGASYLALNTSTQVFTIEGCPKISEFAQRKLNMYSNINFFVGEFSSQLNTVLKLSGKPDLVYIDGNHTYEGTLDYFNFFIKNAKTNTILVFDDIHWSKEMEKAWTKIIQANEVTLSLDLFRMGIVFLDKAIDKKHLVLRF
jgi:predicted O-methyltransferase YrrM